MSSTEIDADSMRMAIELTKWFRQESKRIYLISNHARKSDEEEKIYDYIASHPDVSVRDLQRSILRSKPSNYVEDVLRQLVKKGRLAEVVQKGKGRSSTVYMVN